MEDNKTLNAVNKTIDVLGSNTSLLNTPARLLKVLKDNALKIKSGFSAYQNRQNAYRKKQEQLQQLQQKKQQKQLLAKQKKLAKYEKNRQKLNAKINKNKNNPLPQPEPMQFRKSPTVDVGAKVNDFKQRMATELKQGAGLPFSDPNMRKQVAKQQQVKQAKFNKLANKTRKPKLGFNNPNTLKRPKPFNAGQKVQTFQNKQNKEIAKGLSNPVNKPSYEDKIKKIMGVN